jgi:hypothetical protein
MERLPRKALIGTAALVAALALRKLMRQTPYSHSEKTPNDDTSRSIGEIIIRQANGNFRTPSPWESF